MDIKSKLQLSDDSTLQVHWFRSGRRLRLYQGVLCWARQQGLPVQLEHRSLKLLRSGQLLFAEFSPAVLLLWLQKQGLTPEPMPWGWRVTLPQPRCLTSEQEWLEEQVLRLPGQRQRASPERPAHLHDPVQVLLEELRGWPAGDLPPMQAVKAIQRWQVRLRYLQ